MSRKKLLTFPFFLLACDVPAHATTPLGNELNYIFITPQWMDMWWAIALYFILLAGLLVLYANFRIKQAKAAHQIIFEQKRAEHLKEMDEIKTRFFSNITHEFRTPLSLIISPVEQILKDKGLPADLVKKILIVDRNAQHLLRLINQLLEMSRLEAGNMHTALFCGSLGSFVEENVQLFYESATQKKIQLRVDVTKACGDYFFDTEKWEKILFNLISNALKFTSEGGGVMVQLWITQSGEVDAVAHLQVSDTGIGIPKSEVPRIFDRFYRVDQGKGAINFSGSGIGLSLVKELIDFMNGTIEVDS